MLGAGVVCVAQVVFVKVRNVWTPFAAPSNSISKFPCNNKGHHKKHCSSSSAITVRSTS